MLPPDGAGGAGWVGGEMVAPDGAGGAGVHGDREMVPSDGAAGAGWVWVARVCPPRVEGQFGEAAADVGRAYARRRIEVAASALAGVRGPHDGVRSLLLVLNTGGGRSRWTACSKSMHLIFSNNFLVLQLKLRCATCGASTSRWLSLAMAICSGGYSRNHNPRHCPRQHPAS